MSGLPFPELPLTFFTLIKGDNVRQDTTGDVLNLMLRNTGIIDELLSASQVVKFTSDFSVFVHRFLTDGSVIGWHGSFPRGNEKCRHLSSNRFLCVCNISVSIFVCIIAKSEDTVKVRTGVPTAPSSVTV